MMMDKLVRNNVPATRIHRQVHGPEHILRLQLKVYEEMQEVIEDPVDPVEYADVVQALVDLAYLNGVSWAEVRYQIERKARERGTFSKGYIQRF